MAKGTKKKNLDVEEGIEADDVADNLAAGRPVERPLPVIKVVGVSAAGKSTLARGLRNAGYDARPVSQEHSSVPSLWKQFGVPQALIYLDVSLVAQAQRRSDVAWSAENRAQEVARLADAHLNADLVIDTSTQASADVLEIACKFLDGKHMRRSMTPLPPLGETGAPGRT